VEVLGLLLAKGFDRIAALNPCKQNHLLKLSVITSFEDVWTREVILKLTQAGFDETLVLQCKTIWSANEEAMVVKLAVRYTADFVLVDETHINEINTGNKRIVMLTPLIFLILSVDLYLCLL
jgi:hypothetical protein